MYENNLRNILEAKQFIVEVEIDGYYDTQFWVHESYERQYYEEGNRGIREPIINSVQHAKLMTLEEAIIFDHRSRWPTTIYMVDEDGEDPVPSKYLDSCAAKTIKHRLDRIMQGKIFVEE